MALLPEQTPFPNHLQVLLKAVEEKAAAVFLVAVHVLVPVPVARVPAQVVGANTS